MQYRQGDVMLVRCDAIPAEAVRRARENGRVILAHGEVTGHAHAVLTDAEAVEAFLADLDGETYLSAAAGATIGHEEHGTITLPPGVYRVVRQREYTPTEIRNVED